MLDFAVKYHPAIDTIMAAQDLGLRDYKLDQAKWKIAKDLGDILKVTQYFSVFHSNPDIYPGFQRWYTVLLPCNSKSSRCHPHDGPH
jgi:hypothetical protein